MVRGKVERGQGGTEGIYRQKGEQLEGVLFIGKRKRRHKGM